MKADLTERIIYTFSLEEIEKAKSFKESHLKDGFSLVSEFIPTSKEAKDVEGDGYIELVKKTTFSKK